MTGGLRTAFAIGCLAGTLFAWPFGAPASTALKPIPVQIYDYGDIPQGDGAANGQLPNATLENEPGPGEAETQQVGGAGWHIYTQVGALRCPGAEAIIGVRTRRGSAIDYMQVACAPVTCNQRGCSWSGKVAHFGPSAGNPQGGQLTDEMYCPTGYVVSGFRANPTPNGDFLQDITFECARVTGRSVGLSGQVLNMVADPAQQVRMYGRGNFGNTSELRRSLPPRTWAAHVGPNGVQIPGTSASKTGNRISECLGAGTTALSIAVGRWGLLQTPVIQAFSMFCGQGIQESRPETE